MSETLLVERATRALLGIILERNSSPVQMSVLNESFKQLGTTHIPYKILGYPSLKAYLSTVPGLKFISVNGIKQYVVRSDSVNDKKGRAMEPQNVLKVIYNQRPIEESDVKKAILSILDRFPQGMSLSALNEAYKQAFKELIPFKRLGYNKLKIFLSSQELSINGQGGEIIVSKVQTSEAPVKASFTNEDQEKMLKANLQRTLHNLQVLFKDIRQGVELSELCDKYATGAGEPLNYERFGFQSLREFLFTCPEISIQKVNGRDFAYFRPRMAEFKQNQSQTSGAVTNNTRNQPAGLNGSTPAAKNSSMVSKESVVSFLKACIISSPHGVLASDLNREYKALVGKDIPFAELGFNSLPALIKHLPEFEVVRRWNTHYIQVRDTESSQHIANLVKGQKNSGSGAKFKRVHYAPPRMVAKQVNSHNGHFSSVDNHSENGHDGFTKQPAPSKNVNPVQRTRKAAAPANERSSSAMSRDSTQSIPHSNGAQPLVASEWELLIDKFGCVVERMLVSMPADQKPLAVNLMLTVLKEGLLGSLSQSTSLRV